MQNTKEVNAILATLTDTQKRGVEIIRNRFNDAWTEMTTQITAVIGTYVSKVTELCEKLEDLGLDREEITTLVKAWTPTRKDGEKKPGTLSRQHIHKTLVKFFDRPTVDGGKLVSSLRDGIMTAEQDAFAFMTSASDAAAAKARKTREEKAETAAKEKLVAENPEFSLVDGEVKDADGNTVEPPKPETKKEHAPTKSNVEILADVLAESDADLIAAALVRSGKVTAVMAALQPSVLPAAANA